METRQLQGFTHTYPFSYTYPIVRHSLLYKEADYGNGHDFSFR